MLIKSLQNHFLEKKNAVLQDRMESEIKKI